MGAHRLSREHQVRRDLRLLGKPGRNQPRRRSHPSNRRRVQDAARLHAPRVDVATAPRTARSGATRSEEHTSELQSLMRISYAVFCLKKKNHKTPIPKKYQQTSNTTKDR